jgi:hypothetical protein
MKFGIIRRFNNYIKADISYWTSPKIYPLMIGYCLLPLGHPFARAQQLSADMLGLDLSPL